MNAVVDDEVLHVELEDGRAADLHVRALRDGCPCAECRHPVSGQRLFETLAVVPEAQVVDVSVDGALLRVEWADGHVSTFDESWLAPDPVAAPAPVLWGSELEVPSERYDQVVADPSAKRRWLSAVAEYGFCRLRGAPVADGAVAQVAELFGHVRVTNYGRIFDVAVSVDATNLANTSMPLSLHTDNPYRDPVPTLQLLECLATDVPGGDTVLADGFRAVELLRERAPEKVELLANRPIAYAYRDATADLRADVPVLTLDPSGAPTALRINNRSKAIPHGSADEVGAWYDAYLELLRLLHATQAQVVFRLEPGDVIVFDNVRVLHGRTDFAGTGSRRLQGCYADRDALLSALRLLERAAA